MVNFENDIEKCLSVLKSGGLILYPTDTIWGIGCDATNENAVDKIYKLKKRPDEKSMIILVADENEITSYVNNPDKKIYEFLQKANKPTTVIYQNAIHLPENLISSEKTIAIRIVKDEFCKTLIKEFGKPVVSTSANVSGEPSPKKFNEISDEIKNGVDYIVQHRRNDLRNSQPSSIIKFDEEGNIIVLR